MSPTADALAYLNRWPRSQHERDAIIDVATAIALVAGRREVTKADVMRAEKKLFSGDESSARKPIR